MDRRGIFSSPSRCRSRPESRTRPATHWSGSRSSRPRRNAAASRPGCDGDDRRTFGRWHMYEEISISMEQASDAKVLIISVAAKLAGMHPQTLRQYDRLGLVQPGRAGGGGRRYSERDVALLREVQKLSQDDGVNLAGIKRIIGLEQLVVELQERIAELDQQLG